MGNRTRFDAKTWLRPFICLTILLSFFVPPSQAADTPTVKIGFVGSLTGRHADLGIEGRNGVTLAVEEINRAGGLRGRLIELITKDDKNNPGVAVSVDTELISEGVVAIIGHMTSAMSDAAIPLVNKHGMIMISPTTSSNKFTGIDDYFFRVMVPSRSLAEELARYSFRALKLRRIVTLYDLSNRAYTEEYSDNFRNAFEDLGGRLVKAATFTTGPNLDFRTIARDILSTKPDGLLLSTGALDAAMIIQHVRREGSRIPIVSSGWAQTTDFLHHGGPAVEGVVFVEVFDNNSKDKRYTEFRERFVKRFGRTPNFAAACGYEAVQVIFDALSKNSDPRKLKETILSHGTFRGLQGDFTIDRFGDAKRKTVIISVKAGQFVAIK
jgi:branched-chain amino acid transport system substrate-binding protein